jgi:hypothetical protein
MSRNPLSTPLLFSALLLAGCAAGQDSVNPDAGGGGGSTTSSGSGGSTGAGTGGATGTAGRSGGGGATGSGTAGTSGSGTAGTSGGTGAGGGHPATLVLPWTESFEDAAHVHQYWIAADANGTWALTSDGTQVWQATVGSTESIQVGGDVYWTDQVFELRVKVLSTSSSSWTVNLYPRFMDLDNYYQMGFYSSGLQLHNRLAGNRNQLGDKFKAPTPPTTGVWYTVRVSVVNGAGGATITASIDGMAGGLTFQDPTPIPNGGIGIGVQYATVEIDDVKVSAP